MRRCLIALMLVLLGTAMAHAQTLWESSTPPPTPPDNNSVAWNPSSHLLEYGSGGNWVNESGAGGGAPAGSIGNLQINGNGSAFGAFAGSACPANQVALSDNASGAFACATITSAYVDTSIAKTGTDINTSNQVTVTHLASPGPVAQGFTGQSTLTANGVLYGQGTSPVANLVLTDDQILLGHTSGAPTANTGSLLCGDSTHALAYSHAAGFFCQAISASGGVGSATMGQVLWDNGGAIAGVGGTGFVFANGTGTPTVVPFQRIYASNYGAVGDDTTDDTTALNNAEAAAEALAAANPVIASGWAKEGIVVLDAGKTYKISGNGVSINAGKVGWNFNNSCLDARTVTSGQNAITITSPANSYNAGMMDHLCVFGPSQSSNTVGVMLAANHVQMREPNISSFQTCEGIGDNAYTDNHVGGDIFNCGTAVDSCEQTNTNKGEGIEYNGTNIFNSTTGMHGGCHTGGSATGFYLHHVHLDGLSGTAISNENSSFDATDSYIEYIGAAASATVINSGIASSNQYTYVRWIGGQIQADSVTNPNITTLINNNSTNTTAYGQQPWVQFNGVAIKGFLPSASCANGSGDTCITGNEAGYVSLKNITTLDGLYDTPSLGNDHFPYYPNQMPTCSGGFNSGQHWTVYQVPACVPGKTMDSTLAGTNICDAFCDGSRIIIMSASSATAAVANGGTGTTFGSQGNFKQIANASSTGTTANTLTKYTGAPSTAIIASTSDTNGIVGICTANCSTTGNATIQLSGSNVSCVFDAGTTAGHFVVISNTTNSGTATAGNCHDGGATLPASSAGQLIGVVLSTNGGAGTYGIDLFPPGSSGSSSPGFNTGVAVSAGAATMAAKCSNAGCADITTLSSVPTSGILAITTATAASMTTGELPILSIPTSGGAPTTVTWTAGAGVTLKTAAQFDTGFGTTCNTSLPATGFTYYQMYWDGTNLVLQSCSSTSPSSSLSAGNGGTGTTTTPTANQLLNGQSNGTYLPVSVTGDATEAAGVWTNSALHFGGTQITTSATAPTSGQFLQVNGGVISGAAVSGGSGGGGTVTFAGTAGATSTAADGTLGAYASTGNSTTASAPATNTDFTNELVVAAYSLGSSNFSGAPSITNRVSVNNSSGNNYGIWVGDQAVATATSVAAVTGTLSSNTWIGETLAIKPAVLTVAPTFVEAANTIGSNVSVSTAVAVPTSPTNCTGSGCQGDVFVASISWYAGGGTTGLTNPGGWTCYPQAFVSGAQGQELCWHKAGGSEPATYTWTGSGSVQAVDGAILVYSGQDATNPIDLTFSSASGTFAPANIGNTICMGQSTLGTTNSSQCGTITGTTATRIGLSSSMISYVPNLAGATTLAYDYGPLNDTAMTTAVNAVSTSGGSIIFPQGVFLFSQPITFNKNITVVLQGQGAGLLNYICATCSSYNSTFAGTGTVLVWATQALSQAAITFTSGGAGGVESHTNSAIRNLTIYATAGATFDGGGNNGIDILSTEGVTLHNTLVANFKGPLVRLDCRNTGDWVDSVDINQSYFFYSGALAATPQGALHINGNGCASIAAISVQNNQFLNNAGPWLDVIGGASGGVASSVFDHNNNGWNDYLATSGNCEAVLAQETGPSDLSFNNDEILTGMVSICEAYGGAPGWNITNNRIICANGNCTGLKVGVSSSSLITQSRIAGNQLYSFGGNVMTCASQMFIDPTVSGAGTNSCNSNGSALADPMIQSFSGTGATKIPAFATYNTGTEECVTDDASACTLGTAYTTGGSTKCLVQSTGAAWQATGSQCVGGIPH